MAPDGRLPLTKSGGGRRRPRSQERMGRAERTRELEAPCVGGRRSQTGRARHDRPARPPTDLAVPLRPLEGVPTAGCSLDSPRRRRRRRPAARPPDGSPTDHGKLDTGGLPSALGWLKADGPGQPRIVARQKTARGAGGRWRQGSQQGRRAMAGRESKGREQPAPSGGGGWHGQARHNLPALHPADLAVALRPLGGAPEPGCAAVDPGGWGRRRGAACGQLRSLPPPTCNSEDLGGT